MTDDAQISITTELDDARGRFVARNGEAELGAMTFSRAGEDMMMIDHTEVHDEARGLGVGERLFHAMVAWARDNELRVIPVCPYATSMFRRHADARDVL